VDIEAMIKVVWLLYRRAKWQYLADLGLRRSEVEPLFHKFDMQYIVSERGTITTKRQLRQLVKLMPAIVPAAVELQKHLVEGTYHAS
jgi:hypothetical protein